MFTRSTDSYRPADTFRSTEVAAAAVSAAPPSYAAGASAAGLYQVNAATQLALVSADAPVPAPTAPPIARMVPPVAPPATVVPSSDGRATPGKVSVIGNDLTILGQGITIISKGSLQLDGEIQGNLHGTEILIGEKGRVEGTISAQSVVIRGTVSGTIKALRVALQEGAHVDGEIYHQTLVLDAKAHFEGKVRRPQNPEELMPNLDPAAHEMKNRKS